MPTVLTHTVVAVSAGYAWRPDKRRFKLFTLLVICAILPDADVIGYIYLYIPYDHFLGHRGFFHSLFFAALLSLTVVSVGFREQRMLSKGWWALVGLFFTVTGSHGLLDALTDGGLGIALLSPFVTERYFWPWTPIKVSPLTLSGVLSQRGLSVLFNEMLWIGLPCLLMALGIRFTHGCRSRTGKKPVSADGSKP